MIENQTTSAHGFARARQVSALVSRVSYLIATGRKDKAAHVLTYGLYGLGGVYVKYLQMGATLVPDFPGLDATLRAKVFDNVAHPNLNVQAILREELGPDYQQDIVSVSSLPIAAGSFAGVYAATHRDGTQLIIKVLRPNLRRQLRTDLRLLGILARSTQPFFRSDLVNLVGMYKEFRKSVSKEIDYIHEVENAQTMAEMYADCSEIVIPKTYSSLSTANIIVQERLFGIPLSELLAKDLKGEQAENYVRQMIDSDLALQLEIFGTSQLLSALEGPYLHGDIHPGNVFFLPDNKIGLIDFGVMLKRISNPHALFAVIQNEQIMAFGGDVDIAEHATRVFRLYNEKVFLSMERISKELDNKGMPLDIIRELRGLIEKIIEPNIAKIRDSYRSGNGIPVDLLLDAINHDNQFALRVDESIARIARTQGLFWRSLKNLGLMRQVGPKINDSVASAVNKRPQILGRKPVEPTIAEATEIFLDWYSELVERNPLVFGPLFAKMKDKLDKYNKEVSPVDA